MERETTTDVPRDVFVDSDGEKLLDCCIDTMKTHSRNNPMMVCSHCKKIIKCFHDDRAFSNYVKFCQSRHRKIMTTNHGGYHVVVFSNYDTFGSGVTVKSTPS